MSDTNLTGAHFGACTEKDPFASVAFDDESDTSDSDSFGTLEDIEVQLASDDTANFINEDTTDTIDNERLRSGRKRSVNKMKTRLMVNADDYYRGYGKNRKSKIFCRLCLLFGALAITAIILAVRHFHQQLGSASTANVPELPVKPETGNNYFPQESITTYKTPTAGAINPSLINVPFAQQHNLQFDGVLFVKEGRTDTRESSSPNGDRRHSILAPTFDSYAKTLDPITEVHFSPGEATTTKHIVLTTTKPSDANEHGVNGHGSRQTMNSDEGLILAIGLEANGEMWLPVNARQSVPHYDGDGGFGPNHNADVTKIVKRHMYGPGDHFVLKIAHDTIRLFQNDYSEMIAIWENPLRYWWGEDDDTSQVATVSKLRSASLAPPTKPHSIYAQVWFKDPKSSMMATAWHYKWGEKIAMNEGRNEKSLVSQHLVRPS